MVRAVLAWTVCYILRYKVILTTSIRRMWYISTTLLLLEIVLGGLEDGKLKVAPDDVFRD